MSRLRTAALCLAVLVLGLSLVAIGRLRDTWLLEGTLEQGRFVLLTDERSPTGMYMAGIDPSGRPQVRDVDGTSRAVLTGHEGPTTSVQFSPDGRSLLSTGLDGTARVWDWRHAAERLLVEAPSALYDANFAPSGLSFLTVGEAPDIRIWSTRTGALLRSLRGHESAVVTASYSQDGSTILSASWDGTLRVWDADSGGQRALLPVPEAPVRWARFTLDGDRILAGHEPSRAWVWVRRYPRDAAVLARRPELWSAALSTLVLAGLGVSRLGHNPSPAREEA